MSGIPKRSILGPLLFLVHIKLMIYFQLFTVLMIFAGDITYPTTHVSEVLMIINLIYITQVPEYRIIM